MRLTVVGCSGSGPGPDSPASCYLVEAPDAGGRVWRLLLDLGNGALGALQRFCDPLDVDAVLLSHLHPDHCVDVASLYVLLRYRPANAERPLLPVWGPTGVADRLGRLFDPGPAYDPAASDVLADRFDVREWRPRVPVTVGPVTVTPVPVRHTVETYGVRLSTTGPDGRRVVLAYSGDTDVDPGLDEVASDADLLLCEAGFGTEEDYPPGVHLTGRTAGETAAAADVGRLVVTHVPSWYDAAGTHAAAAAAFDGPVDLAAVGRTWDVRPEVAGAPGAPGLDLAARLDPEHRVALDDVDPLDLSDPVAARAEAARQFRRLPRRPGSPRADVAVADARAPGPPEGPHVPVRTYRPRSLPAAAPALVWFHGGGLIMGEVAEDDDLCADLAGDVGCVVVSVGYRLAPEHRQPAAVEDGYTALRWVHGSARELAVDPARVAVGGHSAGGGLAAGVAILARERGGPAIAFQLLVAPMLDDRTRSPSALAVTDPRVWNREHNVLAWRAALGPDAAGAATRGCVAPARARDLSRLPPAYVSVGDLDMFLDEDVDYALRLGRAGVPVELHVYPGAFHGSESRVPDAALSHRILADRTAALQRALTRR